MTYHSIGGAGYVLPGAQVYSAVVAAAAAGGGFAPTDISGCVLWLDASDVSSLFQDTAGSTAVTTDGQTIGRWSDKSGNSNHVTQATSESQPTYKTSIQNGLSVARFDGGDQLDLPSTVSLSEFTVFGVYGIAADISVAWIGSATTGALMQTQLNRYRYSVSDGGFLFTTAIAPGDFLTSWTKTGNTNTIYSSGVSVGVNTARSGSINIDFVGRGGEFGTFFTGDIFEIAVYNSALGTTDRENVESYLATKWGL